MTNLFHLGKSLARRAGIDTTALYQTISRMSIEAAIREQGLEPTCARLRSIVPDLRRQYNTSFGEDDYRRLREVKARGVHAWQTECARRAFDHVGRPGLTVIDLGDSAGTHALYLKEMAAPGQIGRWISVTLDSTAAAKIRSRGIETIQHRVEDLDFESLKPDISLAFEVLEHLTDPLRFLHTLAIHASAFVLFTVPFRRVSRFGGYHLRTAPGLLPNRLTAEEVHIFELSAEDWILMARLAGFRPVFTSIYWQYPKRSYLRITAPLWRKLDFEGFFAAFLVRDLSLVDRYADW